MKKITFKEYKEEIKKHYEVAKNEDISGILHNPSPAQLRNLCSIICDKPLSNSDEGVLKLFFETKANETLKKSIDNCNIDKFRPVISFLKGEKDSENSTRIELSAILVNFQPRPYANFLTNNNSKEFDNGFLEKFNFVKPQQESQSKLEVIEHNEKIKSNKKRVLIAAVIFFGLFCFGYFVKDVLFPTKDCMQWQNDHYELVNCNCETEGFISLNEIKPIDTKEVTLRKIEVDTNTEFFRNGKPAVWYCKIDHDSIEFFNNHGFHPLNQKALKPITHYIINKYIFKD